ncbi:hypothetical protein BC829DRAFT_442287 [Chytridium lagenaria]|nr:hypothetical protein BC829DRAFT_442287 [Chytridium lagenaria]
MSEQALALYRSALRAIRVYPGPYQFRIKLAQNAREVMEIHKFETSAPKIAELIQGGHADVKAARMEVKKEDLDIPVRGWGVREFAFGFRRKRKQ